jgi:WD40 repeat protein
VGAIFAGASDLQGDARVSYLDNECAGDADLRREVESLLALDGGREDVLDGALVSQDVLPRNVLMTVVEAGRAGGGTDLAPGARLGTYTVESLIGVGGMGAVYRATQDRPRRTVALKIIRPGMASAQLIKRLEVEVELLGRLRHPGIAQIYEAGVAGADGDAAARPFFAMELVPGPSITAYAQRERLDTRARLELFARVCDAVQHAHQRAVIHRDLKPANILMGEGGQPKILDFGVARAADADARVTTMRTSAGQIIGTIAYMSPEQIAGDPSDVDTRADVYALGVVAYELLTGRLPHAVESRSIPEAARRIVDEPPTRLSSIDRTLRGDVETIIAKALAKDKARRYQSAADLAADIRAHLDGRPIAARQDSALYVLRRQIARNKPIVAAATALLLGLAGFAVYADWQARVQRDLAAAERTARHDADRANLAAQEELASSRVERGRLLALSGSPAAGEDLLWPEFLTHLDSRRRFFALWELYKLDPCEATLRACGPQTQRVRVSPKGDLVAASGLNPPIIVWRTGTYQEVARFGTSGVAHGALCFSHDGDLASGDEKGAIVLWDPTTGREKARLADAGSAVVDLECAPDGAEVAAALSDGSVMVIPSPVGGARPERYKLAPRRRGGRPPGVTALLYAPASDGDSTRRLILGCTDARIRIARLPGLEVEREIDNPGEGSPRLALSPDGERLASGGTARLARVWDIADGKLVATLRAANGYFNSVAFDRDGTHLATCGWWYVQLWDIADEKLERSFSLGYSSAETRFSPDGTRLWASVGDAVRVWELDPHAGRSIIESGPPARSLTKFLPDGSLLAGEADGRVLLLPKEPGAAPIQLAKGTNRVRNFALGAGGNLVATLNTDGQLLVIDLPSRKIIYSGKQFWMKANNGATFDSKAARLAVPMRDFSFQIISIPEGKTLVTIPPDGEEALSAAFSPDDRVLATTTRGRVRLYDADTGKLLRECEDTHVVPWCVVFSADGSRVISGNWSRTIDVYEAATGRLIRRLGGHRGLVTDLALRPGEPNILASSGADGKIMLWDLSEPQNVPVLTLDGFDDWECWTVDFDRDGRHVMSTNSLGRTVIWDLRHFDRHIGGNMAARIAQHRAGLGATFDESKAAATMHRLLGENAAASEPRN